MSGVARAGDCVPGEPIPGTAAYAIATASAARYMQLASAARYAERVILPRLARPRTREDAPAGGFFGERADALWGVGSVPIGVAGDGDECKVGRAPFDFYSGNVGFGLRAGPAHAFYAAGMAIGSEGEPVNRLVSPLGLMTVGPVYSLLAPALGASSGTYYGASYSLDYIGGAGFTTPWLTGAVGYAGSKGLFGNLTQPDLKLFAASALRSIDEVAYLRAGLEWLKLTREQVTSTTIFFRTLAQAPALRDGGAPASPATSPSLQTVHVEQRDIAGLVDLTAAYGVGAFAKLHQASLRVRTPGYMPESVELKRRGLGTSLPNAGAALTLGVVRVPERLVLGQSGDAVPHVALQAGMPAFFSVALRFNDPEIVALYPAAGNSVSFSVEGTFAR